MYSHFKIHTSLDSPLIPFTPRRQPFQSKPCRQPPVISSIPSSKHNHVPQIHSLTGLPHAIHVPFFRLGHVPHISHESASSVSKLNTISNIRIGSAYSVWLEITSSWP